MTRRSSALVLLALLSLAWAGCNNQGTSGGPDTRQATVTLQDGKKVKGTVKSSSSSEMTVVGKDNVTQTIPMDQVKSVTYSNAAPAPSTTSTPGQPSQPTPPTKTYNLPAGTAVTVRNDQTIDSATAAGGQTFAGEVTSDVKDDSGAVAIPQGSVAQLTIVSASKGGHIRGASDLVLRLATVTVGGQQFDVNTGNLQKVGKPGMGKNKRTAEFTGGGAALGAIIGAIAGGGKGAAIGAAAGAGGGAATQALTKGKAVQVPAESVMTFKLEKPLEITVAQ